MIALRSSAEHTWSIVQFTAPLSWAVSLASSFLSSCNVLLAASLQLPLSGHSFLPPCKINDYNSTYIYRFIITCLQDFSRSFWAEYTFSWSFQSFDALHKHLSGVAVKFDRQYSLFVASALTLITVTTSSTNSAVIIFIHFMLSLSVVVAVATYIC